MIPMTATVVDRGNVRGDSSVVLKDTAAILLWVVVMERDVPSVTMMVIVFL